jgi:LAGLIDADG DNA endonuclease family
MLLKVSIRNGNLNFFFVFVFNVVTRSYTKLLILFHLFYTTRNRKKIKTINNELLIYLDEIALAYRAMDDGAWTKSGFIYIQKDLQF